MPQSQLPRHIPPRRPGGGLWERVRSWGIFGFVLVGIAVFALLDLLIVLLLAVF